MADMAGAVQTKAYKRLLKSLVKARMDASQSQADLAKRLGKPPSFIGKYELGERRIDVVETWIIIDALGHDPIDFLRENLKGTPKKL